MSLIDYTEPANVGDIFSGVFEGLAIFIMSMVLIFIFWRLYIRLAHYLDSVIDKEIKYSIMEDKMLEGYAKEKGIDLEAELIKRKLVIINKKSFRNKLEDETYKKMFGEDKVKEKKS